MEKTPEGPIPIPEKNGIGYSERPCVRESKNAVVIITTYSVLSRKPLNQCDIQYSVHVCIVMQQADKGLSWSADLIAHRMQRQS